MRTFTSRLCVVALAATSCGDGGASSFDPTDNHAPRITSTRLDLVVTAGETDSVVVSATDSDGHRLTFGILANPGFLSISENSRDANTTSALLIVAPARLVAGVFSAQVRVADPFGAVDSATIRVDVLPMRVDSVSVEPGGFTTIYPSTTVQLTATPLGYDGLGVAGRDVEWSSADPLVADVDSSGLVTAIMAGTVTITATSEGVSGALGITIAPEPVVDWDRATDWVAYQGNASHTGFVEATLDPRTFAEVWTAAPVAGAVLNRVVAGGGSVYVSTRHGAKVLSAIDAASGTVAWSYNFGNVHGLSQAAYADGKVFVVSSGHSDSYLWAFQANDGTVVFQSAYSNQWSIQSSPVVVDGAVFMGGGYYGGMYSFDAANGVENWFVTSPQRTPAVDGGVVYAFTVRDSPTVKALDANTGTTNYDITGITRYWRLNRVPVLDAPDNLLVSQGNRLISFDLATQDVRWVFEDSFEEFVTVANGVVYVSNRGQIEARAGSDGAVLWTWLPPAGTLAGETLATDNLLFVSTSSATFAVDLATRGAVWRYPESGSLALSSHGLLLIVVDDRIIALDVR